MDQSDQKFNIVEQFIQKGVTLEGEIIGLGRDIRERSKEVYGTQLLDARLICLAVLRHLQDSKSCIPGTTSPNSSERLVLIATFCQGVSISEQTISEGNYIKAAAALRQDYEILTRILEVKSGSGKPGDTPNVKWAPSGSQPLYGDLSNIVHPSNPSILESLLYQVRSGDIRGIGHLPTFNEQTARELYRIHVWLLFEITREAFLLFEEMYGQSESALKDVLPYLGRVCELLQDAGFQKG